MIHPFGLFAFPFNLLKLWDKYGANTGEGDRKHVRFVRVFATSDCPTVATLSEQLFTDNGLDVAEGMKRLKNLCHDVFDKSS